MTFPVKAVNKVMRVLGYQTINRVDLLNPDTADAYAYIEDADLELQSEGWWFNTDFDVTLHKDADGFIIVASNVLDIKFFNTAYIIQDGRVYDRVKRTYVFDSDISTFSATYLRSYEKCPPLYQVALIARAKYDAFSEIDGDANVMQKLMRQDDRTYLKLKAQQLAKREDTAITGTYASKLLSGWSNKGYSSRNVGVLQTMPW